MGIAAAQRLGNGRQLILAEFSLEALEHASTQLKPNGYSIEAHQVDIADYTSVTKLAMDAAGRGDIEAVIHTAGLSPLMSSAARILAVDLVCTANVIDAFAKVVSRGSSVVCIASMAGHLNQSLPPESEQHLATTPVNESLRHEAFAPGKVYTSSKRANILRVQAAAKLYGERGARINSISPGIIATPMGEQELAGPMGDYMNAAVALSATQRKGTAYDIADAVAFLVGPSSSFVTGSDLLVDGGCVGASRWTR